MSASDFITIAADGYRYNITPDTLPAGSYTGSVYMKLDSGTVNVGLRAFGTGDAQTIIAALTTSWQRFSVTITTTGSGQISFGLDQRVGNGGPGVAALPIVWGLMINDGVQAQDYIPTESIPVVVSPASVNYISTYVYYVVSPAVVMAVASLYKSFMHEVQTASDGLATMVKQSVMFRTFTATSNAVASLTKFLGLNIQASVEGLASKVLRTTKILQNNATVVGSWAYQAVIVYTRRIVTYIRTLRLW